MRYSTSAQKHCASMMAQSSTMPMLELERRARSMAERAYCEMVSTREERQSEPNEGPSAWRSESSSAPRAGAAAQHDG